MNTYHVAEEDRVKRVMKTVRIIGVALVGVSFAVLFALLFGYIVMRLWNWLMPTIFGLRTITYWQGFGLTVLAKILFSSIHRPPHHCGEDHIHRKVDRQWHRWMGIEDNGPVEEEIFQSFHSDRRHQFKEFWERQGRASFERYLEDGISADENAKT